MPGIEVKLSGPLFSGDPSAKVKAAQEGVIRTLVEDGTKHLAEMLRPRPGGVYLSVGEAQKGKASTGNYRRNLSSEVKPTLGRLWDGGVVYGPWLEDGGSRRRFAGYASFRKTGDWLNERAGDVCSQAAIKLARELGG